MSASTMFDLRRFRWIDALSLLAVALLANLMVWQPLVALVLVLPFVLWWAVRIFNQPFLGVLTIVALLPFERVGSVDVGGMNLRLHQVVALWTLAAWLWHKLRTRHLRFDAYPLGWPLWIFWLVSLLSLTQSMNLRRSVLVLAFTVFVGIVALMIIDIVRRQAQLNRISRWWILSAVGVSLFGLWQFAGESIGLPSSLTLIREGWYNKEVIGVPRLHSTSLEPLYFVNYLLTVFPLVFAWILAGFRHPNLPAPFKQNTLLGMAVIMGTALILTISRGGYLAMFFAFAVVGLLSFRHWLTPRVFKMLGLGILSILLYIVLANLSGSNLTPDFLVSRATSVGETSADLERLETYGDGYRAWLSSPWLGIGIGNFGAYRTGVHSGAPDGGWGIVNNEYLELLAETGLLGFLALFGVIGLWVWRTVRLLNQSRGDLWSQTWLIALLGSLAGMLLQYMTFSTLYIMHLWVFLGVGAAVQNVVAAKVKENRLLTNP